MTQLGEESAALSVSGLGVSFLTPVGPVTAVENVDLELRRGEIVGLVGESGSGKSVTALALMGLLPPDLATVRGQVRLDGRSAFTERNGQSTKSAWSGRVARGRDIAMIFQEPMTALDPVYRVGEQIAEAARTHAGLGRREAKERAVEMLAEVGIPDPARRARAYPHELSGGMRQRVMIAIALVSNPAVLIADEPTTALDVTIQAQILVLLQQLAEEHSTAVLLITHDLGVVAETCHRVHTMYAGQLIESASVDEVLTRPQHPYTSGLISSAPRGARRRSELSTIPGRVPALAEMPTGCRFAPRCAYVGPDCLSPQVLVSRDGRSVRCCRADELVLPGALAGVEQ